MDMVRIAVDMCSLSIHCYLLYALTVFAENGVHPIETLMESHPTADKTMDGHLKSFLEACLSPVSSSRSVHYVDVCKKNFCMLFSVLQPLSYYNIHLLLQHLRS